MMPGKFTSAIELRMRTTTASRAAGQRFLIFLDLMPLGSV